MSKTAAYALMLGFAVLTALIGHDGMALASRLRDLQASDVATNMVVAMQGKPDAIKPVVQLIEWLKVIGAIVGMVFGMLGVWVYFRTTIRTKTNEALQATVAIYKDQIDAWSARDVQRERDYKEALTTMADREKEVIILRARTDLSEVLKASQLMIQSQNELLNLKKSNDREMAQVIASAVIKGDDKYEAITTMLAQMMKANEDRDNLTAKTLTLLIEQSVGQAKENGDHIKQFLSAVNSLSARFGTVEKKVDRAHPSGGRGK